jgi:hypothetical protein
MALRRRIRYVVRRRQSQPINRRGVVGAGGAKAKGVEV